MRIERVETQETYPDVFVQYNSRIGQRVLTILERRKYPLVLSGFCDMVALTDFT